MVYLPPHTHLGKQTYFCWNALKMVPEVGMPLKDFPLDRIRFVWSELYLAAEVNDFTDGPTRSPFIAVQKKPGRSYKEQRNTRLVLNQHGCQWPLQGPDSHLSNTLCTLDCRSHCCLPVVAQRADVVFYAYYITHKELKTVSDEHLRLLLIWVTGSRLLYSEVKSWKSSRTEKLTFQWLTPSPW